MSNIDQDYPQFLRADREIKEKYLDPLVDPESGTCFAGQELGEVYILAAAIACATGQRIPSRRNMSDVRTYAKLGAGYKVLIRAMALEAYKKGAEYDYDVIFDGKKVLEALEEYANAGLPILYKKVFDGGLDLSIEGEITSMFNKLQTPTQAKE